MKIVILYILCIVLANCKNNTNTTQKSSTLKRIETTIPKALDTLNYTTIVAGKDHYGLEIRTTYLNDTNYIKKDWPTEQNQVVLRQELIFKHKDSVLSQIPCNVRKKSFIKSGRNINLLDAVIYDAASISGSKGGFYLIHGSAGCKDCSTYFGYYSLKGQLLFENYYSNNENFVENAGDFKKILKQFGVSENVHNVKNITVFPPFQSGQITRGYIL